MTKRIIALLLALILTIGLLPTVALAAEGDPTPTTDSGASDTRIKEIVSGEDSKGSKDNPVHVTKSVNDAGTELTLEAYAQNPMIIKKTEVALDIVLVLDVSGSMDGNITSYTYTATNDVRKNGTYYYETNGVYQRVYYCDGHYGMWDYCSGGWFTQEHGQWRGHGGTKLTPKTAQNQSGTQFYTRTVSASKDTKIGVLKTAVEGFITSAAANSEKSNIAIVKFAGKDAKDNNKKEPGDDKYSSGGYKYNYTQLVCALQNAKANKDTLIEAVNKLSAAGATQAHTGLSKAASVLENSTNKKVVILFTDGEPNEGNDFDTSVAAKAINIANQLKQKDTMIYTVAIYGRANPKVDPNTLSDESSNTECPNKINKYLHAVSSNYPNATAKNDNGNGNNWNRLNFGTRTPESNYYHVASDSQELVDIFQKISEEVNSLTLDLSSETAVLQDQLSAFFTFDDVTGSDTSKIKIYTMDAKINAAGDGFEWNESTKTELTTETKPKKPTVTVNADKTLTITGFNYGAAAVTRVYDAQGNVINYTGKKLIVTIPIKPDTNNNTGWVAGEKNYPTNVNDSAKLSYKDEDGGKLSTAPEGSPNAPVKAYTVSYEIVGDKHGQTEPTGGTYIEGQKYNVSTTKPSADGYDFVGWKDNQNCTGDDVTVEQTMGKENVTYYGKFTQSLFPVDFSHYVKKHLTLTGVSALPNGETFTVTGKEYKLVNGNKEYTGKEFAGATDAITNTTSGDVAFTGAGMILSLTAGEHTFEVKETVPDESKQTPGMDYSTTEYTLTVTVAENGNVTANPSTVTIINTYAPTAATLDLTGKFKKVLTSNTLALPTGANSFELTIKNGTTEVAKGTATVALGTTPDATGKFTGEANFTFINGNLTFTSAGTYNYKVTETDSDIAGMKYASEADLTIVVDNDPSTGKLKVTRATINNVNIAAETVTINNTFTAAELPLDPTPDPEDSSVYTRVPIAKAMTGEDTKEDLTFTAEIYNDANVKVTQGTAKVEKAATAANFSGFGALTFNTTGDHTFTIKEAAITPAVPGMTYDVNKVGEGHTMVVSVAENTDAKELYISAVTIDDVDINLSKNTPWLTITNNYIEPKKTFDLNNTIFKTFTPVAGGLPIPTGDGISYTFTAQMKELTELGVEIGESGRNYTLQATLTGEVTEANKVPFTVKEGNEVSFAPGTYYFLVQENDTAVVTGTVNGTIHNDSQAYLLTLTVKEDLTFETKVVTTAVVVTSLEEPTPGLGTITFNNTYEEKKPGTYPIDFSTLIFKVLTKTGDRSFNGAEFTATVEGWKVHQVDISMMRVAVNAFERLDPDVTLKATFPANTTFDTDGKAYQGFTGDKLTVTAGEYLFLIDEINDGQTNITYDESKYWLALRLEEDLTTSEVSLVGVRVREFVEGDTKETVIEATDWTEVPASIHPVYFENTIDTGKDDYYPIIIPTIINKDTGMLNKTDHFAYVIGYPDGTVHPNGQITRAEVATIFFRLLRDEVRDGAFTTSNSYSDVAYGKWYNNPISTMSALGIITGYPDGTFKPNKPITRAEFAAIAARFDETQSGKSATFSDVIGHWAAKEIGIAYYNDWIKGYPDGTFKPDQNITRAEAMTLINRVLERKPESPADLLTNMNKWTDNMDTSKWYYLDVQEATNSHGYTRKTFNYELWRQMLPDPDWSRYER